MTSSTLDIMTKAEALDTEELKDVPLWVEFTLSKRVDSSADYAGGTDQ